MLENYEKVIHSMMLQTLGNFGKVETIIESEWNVITILLNDVTIIRFYQRIEEVYLNMEYIEEKCDGLSYKLMSVIGSVSDLLYKEKRA